MSDIEIFLVLFENDQSMERYIEQSESSHKAIDLLVWGLHFVSPVQHRIKTLALFFNKVFEDVKTKRPFITDTSMLKGISYDELDIPNECGLIKGTFLDKFQPFKKKLMKIAETRRTKTRMSRKQYLSDRSMCRDPSDPYIFTDRDISPIKWFPKPTFKCLQTTKNIYHPDFQSSLHQNKKSLPSSRNKNHFKENVFNFENEPKILRETSRTYSNMSRMIRNNNVETNDSPKRKKSKTLSQFIHLMRNKAEKEFHTEKITKREIPKFIATEIYAQPKTSDIIQTDTTLIKNKENDSERGDANNNLICNNENTNTFISPSNSMKGHSQKTNSKNNNNCVDSDMSEAVLVMELSLADENNIKFGKNLDTIPRIKKRKLFSPNSADVNELMNEKRKRSDKNKEKRTLRKQTIESINKRKHNKKDIENAQKQDIESLQEESKENNHDTNTEYCDFKIDNIKGSESRTVEISKEIIEKDQIPSIEIPVNEINVFQNDQEGLEMNGKCVHNPLKNTPLFEEHNMSIMDLDTVTDIWEKESLFSLGKLSTLNSDSSSQEYKGEPEITDVRTLKSNIEQVEIGIGEVKLEKEVNTDTQTERNEELKNSILEKNSGMKISDEQETHRNSQNIKSNETALGKEIQENVQVFTTYDDLQHKINQRCQENFQTHTPHNDSNQVNRRSQENVQVFTPNNDSNKETHRIQEKVQEFTPGNDSNKINRRSQENVQIFTPNNDSNKVNRRSLENVQIFTPNDDSNKINQRSQGNVQVFTPNNVSNKVNRRSQENLQMFTTKNDSNKINHRSQENNTAFTPNNNVHKFNLRGQENIQVFKSNNNFNKINYRNREQENFQPFTPSSDLNHMNQSSQEIHQVFRLNDDMHKINQKDQENVQVIMPNKDLNKINHRSQENVEVFTPNNDSHKVNQINQDIFYVSSARSEIDTKKFRDESTLMDPTSTDRPQNIISTKSLDCYIRTVSEAALENDHDISDNNDSSQQEQSMPEKHFKNNSNIPERQTQERVSIKKALQKEFIISKETIKEFKQFDLLSETSTSTKFSQKQHNLSTRSNIFSHATENNTKKITPPQSGKNKTTKNSSGSDKSKESFAMNVMQILQKQNFNKKELRELEQNLEQIQQSTNNSPSTDDSEGDLDISDLEFDHNTNQLNLNSNSVLSLLDTISDVESSTNRNIKFRSSSNDSEIAKAAKNDTSIDIEIKHNLFGEDTLKNMEYNTKSDEFTQKIRNLHKIKFIEDENSTSFNSKQFDEIKFSPDEEATKNKINSKLKNIFNEISLKSLSDREDSIKYGIPEYLRNDYADEEYFSSDMDISGHNSNENPTVRSQLLEMVSDESHTSLIDISEKLTKKEQNKSVSQTSTSSSQRSSRIEQIMEKWKEFN